MNDLPSAPQLVHTTITPAGVSILTLNNPSEMNGWSHAMASQFFEQLDEAVRDPDIRALVITGAGKAFCAGAAMSQLTGILNGEIVRPTISAELRRTVAELTSVPKPVIAAVNGAAAGIGMSIAAACDIRFIADNAKLTTAYARRGLAAEYALSWLLPRIVGRAHAADMLLSGRTITAGEALVMGFANWLVEPEQLLDRAIQYAADIATKCAPASIAAIKDQLHNDNDFSIALSHSISLMEQRLMEPDFAEGINAFLERRPPMFASLRPERRDDDNH